ncbi:sortilin-related receptor-like [Sycon ciliatum]|uniref:sortilin-related receptor-like n=1 Tax=Sycon ciliatum TaxID=27933 RepID=UPI0031F707D7
MALSGVAGRGLLAFIFLAAPCCFAEDYVSPLAETLDEAKTRRNLFTHIRKDQAHESHQRPTALIVETPEKLEDLQQNVEKVRSKRGAIPGKAIPHEIVLNDHNPTMAVTWSGVSGNGSHSDVIVALTYSRNSAWLRSRASSHLYVSRDYGKTFPRIELDTPTGIVAKATLVLLCPESAGWGVILDTLNSLMWTTKDDFKTLALQPKVPFYLKQLSCHPNVPSVFLAVSTQQQLYVSKTFTNSWFSATTDPVTRFAWGSNQSYEHQYTIYAELSKGGIIRTDDFFKTRTVISKTGFDMKVQERHVIYLEKDPKQKYNTLMVSYLGKPAVAATFPEYANGTKFVPNEYFIAEILADSIMLAVNHYINLTNLYVSEDGNARFSFSLERILYHNPLSNYVNKYIKKVRADSFVDWHVVDGFPSVIISQQLGFGTVGHRKLHTVMTYDQGGYWSLVKAPALLNNSPTNCHLPNCSLHMVSEFIASLSQYPKIYSVESAPGLIMASAYYGKHYTGKQHVVMTRDNGVHWEFPKLPSSPSPYYDIRAGDHGGIIVAVPYSNIAVNSFYYSVDMGLTWSMFIFGTKQMVVSNIFSEPGETSSVFTLFGRFTGTYLQWAMVTVDLKAKLVRTCEPKDYFDWQPKPAFWDGEDPEGAQCLFGLREFITLRKPKSICYNGMKFERPHNVTSCSCERSDYECDVGYILSGWECLPNNDLVVIQGMKRALNCVAGKNISISKGYRRISGSFCAGGLTSLFEPAVFPCTHTTINKTVEVAFSLKIFRRTSTNGVVGVVTNATIPNSNGTVALSADTLPANASSSIRWQFGDGASTESQPGGTVHHKYSKPGIYTVVASASSRATSHVATVTVHTHELLTGKVPIDVQSYLGSSPLQKNTVILFTANIPQNINPALNYTWQFTYQGDSEKDSATLNTQQSPMVKHSFSTAGRYFVKVEVSGPVNKIHGGQWIYVNDLSPKVSIYPSSTTALVIGWKLPGPPTSARIIVKRVGSPDSEKPLQITTPNDIGSWVATGLVPGADYDVTVATVGERGCGGASAASASVVRLPVTDDSLHVKLSVPGPRTVRVTWRKAVGHTASTTYRVVVVKSDTDSSVEGGKHQPTELPRFVQSALQSPTGDYLHPPQHLELIAINHTTAVLIWQYDVPGVKLFTVTVTQGGNSITQQTSNKFFYAKNLIADTKVHIAVRPTCTSQVSSELHVP